MPDKDTIAALILKKRKPPADEGDGSDPKTAAMEEFIAAVKDGDAHAACEALDAYNASSDSSAEE